MQSDPGRRTDHEEDMKKGIQAKKCFCVYDVLLFVCSGVLVLCV